MFGTCKFADIAKPSNGKLLTPRIDPNVRKSLASISRFDFVTIVCIFCANADACVKLHTYLRHLFGIVGLNALCRLLSNIYLDSFLAYRSFER